MSLLKENKRQKTAGSLLELQNQGLNNINALNNVYLNLNNLKTQIEADSDFSSEDLADIQNTIDILRVQTLAL